MVAYDDSTSDRSAGNIHVVYMDESGRPTGSDWIVGEGQRNDAEPVLVNVCGLTSVIWYAPGGFRIRTFDWPDVESGLAETILVSPFGDYRYPRHTAVRYRDRLIMAYREGALVNTIAVDPWAGAVMSGPYVVIHEERDSDPSLLTSLAPAEERGYSAVCVLTREDDPELHGGAVFRLIDEDGRPIGAGLIIEGSTGPGTTYIRNCDVTWSGSEFLVVYMRQGASEDPRWGLWFQRIRPLI
jgi:hypothetical protein